jgi:diguanylate cyclase (GGDEF)-like protein
MTDKKNERRSSVRQRSVAIVNPDKQHGIRVKEYSYVFRLSSEDVRVLSRYRGSLSREATGFAGIYYDYLFDDPDIADILYAYERAGGDIALWVRTQLGYLFNVLASETDNAWENQLTNAGRHHLQLGFKPVWIISAHHLFIDYLKSLLPGLNLAPVESNKLESVLIKLLLRNLGLIMEGYWQAALHNTENELVRLAKDQGRAEELLGGLPYFCWSVDVKKNDVVFANPSMEALYSDGLEAPLPCLTDTCAEDQQQLLAGWQKAVTGSTSHAEVRMSLAGGELHWYRVSLYPTLNRPGRVTKIHCILEDIGHLITERRILERLATTDSLTDLPNRALWADNLNKALAASRRVPGSQVVVISLDIDQFKMYNDTLGHDVGDILLRNVAERLNTVVRESDSLARLGGDRFGILLQPVNNARTAAERVITQILDVMDIPFTCQDKQLCIGVTLGISCFPEDGVNEESLLVNAESAMQRAKRNGLPYQYFDPLNDVSPAEQLSYSGQIHTALENDEFKLYFQPQVDLQTSRIIGAEALLRWEHPVDGMVMPQRIIPLAEQLGLITPITNWVLMTALMQCRQWAFEGTSVPVSVNVSARSFQNPRLLEKIQWALSEAGVDGDSLEIEITEATLMQDVKRATELLTQLNDCGVSIAIDDFGTGYSSLSYLKRLPIHTLKIDQSFIMDVASDQQDVAIVRSIIDLGHNLGFKVIAEGVETGSSWDMLSSLGCDAAQGFHISKPLPDSHFSSWLSASGTPV